VNRNKGHREARVSHLLKCALVAFIFAAVCPFNVFSESPQKPIKPVRRNPVKELPDSINLNTPVKLPSEVILDSLDATGKNVDVMPLDSVPIFNAADMAELPDSLKYQTPKIRVFSPDPIRAVWMSALFPGLGQAYNRRYWKLPLVVAGFMGLGYGTQWNNTMLRDYTRAYADIMDNDPSTKSYMDFFPSTIKEESLDKSWLTNVLKSRKDFYRRNRDLCIISMVGLYIVAMVDAYVDASLAHFDISPDLSMELAPAFIPDKRNRPGVGLQWALRF
ncbi:MAG: hypothetical protein K2H39_01555, partial [Paramuribaculum sp.]|nr:hypothetical protein [Paramuribaculum sp.]